MRYKNQTAVHKTESDVLSDRNCFKYKNCNSKQHCYRLSEIDSLLDEIRQFVIRYYSSEKLWLEYGFGDYDENEKHVRKLESLQNTLVRHRHSILYEYRSPLCNEELSNIVNISKQIIKSTKTGDCSVLKDCSKSLSDIEITYPQEFTGNCVPYETWERALYVRVPQLDVKVKPSKECKGFVFDIMVKSNADKSDKECFLLDISAKRKNICDISYKVNVDPKVCKIKYDLFVKKHPNCNVSYNLYTKLTVEGFDDELLSQLNELNITVQESEDGFTLTTTEDNTYTLSSLTSIKEFIENI